MKSNNSKEQKLMRKNEVTNEECISRLFRNYNTYNSNN